ncbi:hypothetical protein [Phytoactinopolyspora alkaliphila]|uniref:hypothetical protein n=1 Tax=Phytoactinopolyspora alkaliphila TaxID=1783498 RepID=UPI001FEB90F2|nr:hypothetical protein [Phytoactinopolyspora alkaliphila]
MQRPSALVILFGPDIDAVFGQPGTHGVEVVGVEDEERLLACLLADQRIPRARA